MQIDIRQYPHPVLSYFGDDYIGCAFQAIVKQEVTRNTYVFPVKFRTSCHTINSLIEQNLAKFAIHVECPATRYRKIFKSSKQEMVVDIPADQLDGRLQVCPLIIAEENIDNYVSSLFHPDYEGQKFRIRKGDILAVDQTQEYVAEKEYDPFRKIPSIFSVQKNVEDPTVPMDIKLDTPKIVILLSPENMARYKELSGGPGFESILASTLVLPALCSVLDYLKSGPNTTDIEDLRWFRILCRKLHDIGINIYEPETFNCSTVSLAIRLVDDPLSKGLQQMMAYADPGGDDE